MTEIDVQRLDWERPPLGVAGETTAGALKQVLGCLFFRNYPRDLGRTSDLEKVRRRYAGIGGLQNFIYRWTANFRTDIYQYN